ncbi:MAG: OsmC family protein [Aliidiomarina sp.]|uniref:OsmC family protein n=1 Tax=Aliidiomarina sp. TaxID=1872439 RepID=UPI0025C33E14|nr:OsmC family protein [Aliidiomarina sp.]MCH8501572.1 OsmC family protein [Aliidiomarina sp.]
MSAEVKEGCVRVEEKMAPYTNQVTTHRHRWLADEPESLGGADEGPAPFEMVLAGLGACTSMTLRMYAKRKEWPVEKITVDLRHVRGEKGAESFERHIHIEGDLTDEQRQRLLEIANKCPVHKTLSNPDLEIPTQLVDKI